MKKTISSLFAIIMLVAPFTARAEFPAGYPYSFWGEVYHDGDKTVMQSYFEQGVDLFRIADDKLTGTVFLGTGLNKSTEPENGWENQIVPTVGLKISYPFHINTGGWGSVSLGVRHKWYEYFGDSDINYQKTEVFISVGFGGDWKN